MTKGDLFPGLRVFGIVLLVMMMSLPATSQEIDKKGSFLIGIEGGPQITSIKGFAGVFSPSSGVGFLTGLYGEYYLSNDFRIRLGASFDNRKFGMEGVLPYLVNVIDDSLYYSGKSYYYYLTDYNLNYITIPIGITYSKGNEKFKIMLQANFYYSIFLNAKVEGSDDYYINPDDINYFGDVGYYEGRGFLPGHNVTQYEGETIGFSYDQNLKQYVFSDYDLGIDFRIGGTWYPVQKVGITLGVGFTWAMANLFSESAIDSNWAQLTKFNLGVTYLLLKKNKRFGNK